jgi:hypothetical protein
MALAQITYGRAENTDPQLLALKVPPHSIEAEQSLLGALLLDNQAFDRVADLVTGEDFYRDDHRRLWRHIARLIEASRPADVVTVSESVEASEDKDKTGGPAYLGALAQRSTRPARRSGSSWTRPSRRSSRSPSPARAVTRACSRSSRCSPRCSSASTTCTTARTRPM